MCVFVVYVCFEIPLYICVCRVDSVCDHAFEKRSSIVACWCVFFSLLQYVCIVVDSLVMYGCVILYFAGAYKCLNFLCERKIMYRSNIKSNKCLCMCLMYTYSYIYIKMGGRAVLTVQFMRWNTNINYRSNKIKKNIIK